MLRSSCRPCWRSPAGSARRSIWPPTNVRTVIRNFVPTFLSRGVVQISAYVDALLASLLPTGAVAALAYAQTLYTLPVSLFGMSVSAAELPAMASATGDPAQVAAQLRTRLDARAPADRVLHRSVGRGVRRAGADPRGGAVPVGAVHPRRQLLRLGHPRRLRRRPPGRDDGPALLVGLLRAPRHPDAAPIRGDPRGAHDRAGLPRRDPAPGAAGHPGALGRRRAHRVRGRRGVDRVLPPATGAQQPHRRHRPRPGPRPAALDVGSRGGGARRRGGVGARCARWAAIRFCTRSPCWGCTGRCIFR